MVGETTEASKAKKTKTIKHPCLRCRKDVTKDSKSVQCQTCQFWVHADCQGISDELFKFLVEGEGVCWNCNSCLASSARLERTVVAFEARLKEAETANTKTIGEIKRVDEGLAQLRREFEAEKNRNREAAQNKDDNYISREEYRERELRKMNVIMHRIKEPGDDIKWAEDRRRHDMDECEKIFDELEMEEDEKADIKFCRRIGEKGQDPRPMVVVLRTETTKNKILERAKNLRESSYKEVGIVPELTVQQRREEQQLSEEADRRNREELTTEDQTKNLKWLVVGPRGAKKIIKGVPRNAQPATRGTGWRGRGRGGRARGGTGANSLPLGRQPARIETTLLLPPTQLLPSTAQRERLESNSNKRKDRSEGTEEDEEEMEESTSPARKK